MNLSDFKVKRVIGLNGVKYKYDNRRILVFKEKDIYILQFKHFNPKKLMCSIQKIYMAFQ
jgi:uncharacterized protein YjiK